MEDLLMAKNLIKSLRSMIDDYHVIALRIFNNRKILNNIPSLMKPLLRANFNE